MLLCFDCHQTAHQAAERMKQTISRYAGQCGCIFCHSLWAILSDCGQHATRLLVANDSARNRDYANMHNIILVLEDSMMAASPSLAHELCLPRMPASRSYFVTAGIHIIDSSASRCNAWDEVSSCTFAFRADAVVGGHAGSTASP